jgi:hypothetical protein
MLSVWIQLPNLEHRSGRHLAPPKQKPKQLRQVLASIAAALIPAASIAWLCDQFKQGNTLLLVKLERTTCGS